MPQTLPALLVLQGSADPVVLKVNGMRAAQVWAARTHALLAQVSIHCTPNRSVMATGVRWVQAHGSSSKQSV